MTRRPRVFPRAQADLEDIFAYFDLQSDGDTSARFLACFEQTLRSLCEFPTRAPEVRAGQGELFAVRRWPVRGFRNYLVFFRVEESSVDIVRVLHGAREIDPEALL